MIIPMNARVAFLLKCLYPGLLCLNGGAFAQTLRDTIPDVQIRSEQDKVETDLRRDFTAGQQNQQADTLLLSFYQTRSLAGLISEQSPVFVKSYGVNSMATLSFRGASAAQSAVLWNGVPVANPALGVSDISVLKAGLFDDISLQYGSSSALFGSGNVGGALLLEDGAPEFTRRRQGSLTLGIGSFGRKEMAGKVIMADERWRLKLNVFYEAAENNFSYADQNLEERIMDHARLRGYGGIFSADYNLGNKVSTEVLSFRLWFQQFDRQIPPALFESGSQKQQWDQSLRSLLQWRKKRQRSEFYAKASLNRDVLRYEDGIILPDNRNRVIQFYGETGWRWKINPHSRGRQGGLLPFQHEFLVFAPVQYNMAEGQNLAVNKTQWRPAATLAYSLRSADQRLEINAAFRQEWVSGFAAGGLPGGGLAYRAISRYREKSSLDLRLRFNIQKSYRLPSLNELYFAPGGNEHLKPESGWSQDGGYTFLFRFQPNATESDAGYRWTIQQDLSLFNRNIRDWIYWLGGGIWTPHNLAEVHSRGLETDNHISWSRGVTRIRLSVKTAYVLSTTTASYLPGDGSLGKQIPYTPRYNGQLNLGLSWKQLWVSYNHIYTGYRFVTVDESQFLNPYQAGNLQAKYIFRGNIYEITAAAQVFNLWDTRYEIVYGRPMPGRHFLLTLQLGLGR